jgi:hypothetical protein
MSITFENGIRVNAVKTGEDLVTFRFLNGKAENITNMIDDAVSLEAAGGDDSIIDPEDKTESVEAITTDNINVLLDYVVVASSLSI